MSISPSPLTEAILGQVIAILSTRRPQSRFEAQDVLDAADLRQLGLDAARFGTPAWNPVGNLMPPGAKIVVKGTTGEAGYRRFVIPAIEPWQMCLVTDLA